MADLIKIVNKNINSDLLRQELVDVGLSNPSPFWGGFEGLDDGYYTPSIRHGYPLGELHCRYEPELDTVQEAILDSNQNL